MSRVCLLAPWCSKSQDSSARIRAFALAGGQDERGQIGSRPDVRLRQPAIEKRWIGNSRQHVPASIWLQHGVGSCRDSQVQLGGAIGSKASHLTAAWDVVARGMGLHTGAAIGVLRCGACVAPRT